MTDRKKFFHDQVSAKECAGRGDRTRGRLHAKRTRFLSSYRARQKDHLGSLPRNSVVRLTDRLDMIIVVDWDVKLQIKQTGSDARFYQMIIDVIFASKLLGFSV